MMNDTKTNNDKMEFFGVSSMAELDINVINETMTDFLIQKYIIIKRSAGSDYKVCYFMWT